jgi:hypothetical protein
MKAENICLSSKTIELSETKNYLELTNRVCFYDEPNLNGVMLPYDDSLEKANTLVNQPVVAKYKKNPEGLPTFGGHECSIDANGDVVFGTDNIGTHTEVYIENDDVNVNGTIKNLPCLFAKYRIWTRNKNVVSAVKRLYSEGKLFSSWEISSLAYEFKDGVKKLTDYFFDSNCLLGYEYSFPAYGEDAKAIALSSKDSQLMIAEAFSKDLLSDKEETQEINNKEDEAELAKLNETKASDEVVKTNDVAENQKSQDTSNEAEVNQKATEETPETQEQSEEKSTETSALTEWDLRDRIREACRSKVDKWCWIAYHFPVEKQVWVEYEGSKSELDYLLFTYEVNNDVVTVSDPLEVTLTVSIKEVNTTIANLNSEISEKTDALVEAGKQINELNKQIAELTPYKEQADKDEQVRIEAELQAKKDTLQETAMATGYFKQEEFETSEELKDIINTLDDEKLKQVIATRVIASVKKNTETKEVSTVKEVASASLVNDDEEQIDAKTFRNLFLGGKK